MSSVSQEESTEEFSRRQKKYLRWIMIVPGIAGGLVGLAGALFGNAWTVHYLFWASAWGTEEPEYLYNAIMALMGRLLEGTLLGVVVGYAAVILIALWITADFLWNQKAQKPS